MGDPNELAALKASFRGALATAAALQQLAPQIDALDPGADVGAPGSNFLEDLARVTAAHAIASNALRGLVVTMIARRKAG
jgi:hypothetical protein